MKRSFLILLFCIGALPLLAQNFMSWQYNDRYFSVGAGAGWTGYFGDLSNGKVFDNGIKNASLHIDARLLKHISARLEVGQYSISGTDTNAADSTFEQQRNLSFNANNLSISLSGIYHFLPYRMGFHKRRTYEPFARFGIGVTRFNPKTVLNETEYALREFNTEGNAYGQWAIIIPAGLGVNARINEFIDIAVEVNYTYALTDYLDDVSDQYNETPSSSLASALSDRRSEIGQINEEWFTTSERGNGAPHDAYLRVVFKLQVYLPSGLLSKKGAKERILSKPSAF